MNTGLLSWCKILSLVLLCRLCVVACDHSGSTENSNSQEEGTRPLYSANRNNSNRYGGESKIIYPDRMESHRSKSYRPPKRRYRTGTSRKITDYRYMDNPKMQVENDEEGHHSFHRGDRYDSHTTYPRTWYEPHTIPIRSSYGTRYTEPRPHYEPRYTQSRSRYDSRDHGRPRYDPRTEYLSNKVLMVLDLDSTQGTHAYDVKVEGNKTICRANHPYLFGEVKRGDTVIWKPTQGDYPYKVVCKTEFRTDTCKVYFPDYENDLPPARPTRVDVFKRVDYTKYGPEYMADQLTSDTHDRTRPEMYGQTGKFMDPQHIPTGETQTTPHTSLNVKHDESNVPPDEAVAGAEAAAGEPVDGAAQAKGEVAPEDVKKGEGDEPKADVAAAAPGTGPGARPPTGPGVRPGAMPGFGPGGTPYPMPGFGPRYRPSETEPISHVELMPDYYNEYYDSYGRPEYQPDPLYDDYYNGGQDYIEFTDYSNPAYPQRPDPMMLDPSGRTDFRSHISPRDVVVNTDQDRQGAFDIDVGRKKRENLVLTFANRSNVYVLDGNQHSFALNQSNGETGTNDQPAVTNPNQHISFSGQDSNRVTLDAGSVRMTFPAQVIEGVPLPTGVQPVRTNVQANSNVVINDAQSAQGPSSSQNQRPASGASTAANADDNEPSTSSQPSSQPVSRPQPAPLRVPSQPAPKPQPVPEQLPSQPAPRPHAVPEQVPSQSAPRPQQASQTVTPKPATQSVRPKPAAAPQQAGSQTAGPSQAQQAATSGSEGDIIFADD